MPDASKEIAQKLIYDDYGCSLVTLMWADCGDDSYLAFGTVEMYPKEIEEAFETDIDKISYLYGDSGKNVQLCFCRKKMSCHEALDIYHSCRENGKFTLTLDDIETSILLCKEENNVKVTPEWPFFSTAQRSEEMLCTFLAESWGCCRMHHIFSVDQEPLLLDLTEYEKPSNWMDERLAWDISANPELLGSMHLILPNPVIRSMEERMIPGENNDKLMICFELRNGRTLQDFVGMNLLMVERGHFGVYHGKEYSLSDLDKPYVVLDLAGKAEEIAFMLNDCKRGILEYSNFGGFRQNFAIDMRVANAVRRVHLPKGKTYDVTRYEDAGKISGLDESDSVKDLGRRFAYRKSKYLQKKAGNKYGQRLFHAGTANEAENFIRSLIQSARKQVIIIDPFFDTVDLFKFVLGIPSPVDITIMTSKDVMNRYTEFETANGSKLTIGYEIDMQIKNFIEKEPRYKIQVQVMTGDKPVFHDRFLIIDDEVWLSGNSLNDIGERTSMLLQLPNPQELLDFVDKVTDGELKDRIIKLDEWMKQREKNKNGQREKTEIATAT